LIRQRQEKDRSRFDLAAERGFNWVIGRYDRALNVVLEHQPLTLIGRAPTWPVTVFCISSCPKGFFPCRTPG